MNKILIVDDDPFIRQLMKVTLRNEGYQLMESENGQEALELIERTTIDLAIIDIMMPIMDGWELSAEIRKIYPDMPLLLVTAKGESSDKVKGFQIGADDYLVKPFDPIELALRVKALLRRYKTFKSQMVQLGCVELNRKSYEVIINENRYTLPLKEFELLFMLAENSNQVFTRNQLVEQIWGMDFSGVDRTIDVHINRLRERFPEEQLPFIIKTVRGLGYKLEMKP